MKPKFTTAIILDKRYPRIEDRKCPVKLRVTINRKARYYGLGDYYDASEFTKIYSERPRGDYKKLRTDFDDIEKRAIGLLEVMNPPTFERFKRLFTQKGGGGNVKKYFQMYIDQLKADDQPGTASNYNNAMKSLDDIKDIENADFMDITPAWLKDYQKQMTKKGKSLTTISMYLRALRTIYNVSIKDGIVNPAYYPFGRDKYTIPTARNNKRPLERQDIQALANYSGNPINEKYRDFFLLSYCLMGLNMADILTLRWKQLDGRILNVTRKKTEQTSQNEQQSIEMYVNDFAMGIIEKYGIGKDGFIFDIVDPSDKPAERLRKVKNFTRNANQGLQAIAESIKINPNISTMYARHSAASHGLASGATIGDISQALGHKNIKTTSNYISSLHNAKINLANALDINTTVSETKPETNEAQTQ